MGAYHTIDLDINKKFTLAKGCWDVVALDRLGISTDFYFINYFFLINFFYRYGLRCGSLG